MLWSRYGLWDFYNYVYVHVAGALRCVFHSFVEMNRKMLLPWKRKESSSQCARAMPCTSVTGRENCYSNLLMHADNNNKGVQHVLTSRFLLPPFFLDILFIWIFFASLYLLLWLCSISPCGPPCGRIGSCVLWGCTGTKSTVHVHTHSHTLTHARTRSHTQ